MNKARDAADLYGKIKAEEYEYYDEEDDIPK
jgi:hypothetical protein